MSLSKVTILIPLQYFPKTIGFTKYRSISKTAPNFQSWYQEQEQEYEYEQEQIVIIEMRILEVKFKVEENQFKTQIKIIFYNTLLLSIFDTSKIKFFLNDSVPISFSLDNFSITFSLQDATQCFTQSHLQAITAIFTNLRLTHLNQGNLHISEEDLKLVVQSNFSHKIFGFKRFEADQDHFRKGDYLFCSKGSIKELVSLCQNIKLDGLYLFELDTMLKKYQEYSNVHSQLVKIIVDVEKVNILVLAESQNLTVFEISVKIFEEWSDEDQWHPKFGIGFRVLGNGCDIHKFYIKLEELIANLKVTLVRVNKNSITNMEFDEEINKIYKMTPVKLNYNTIVFVGQVLRQEHILEDIKNILTQKLWQFNQNQEFSREEIQILSFQSKSKRLDRFLRDQSVCLRSLQFCPAFTYFRIKCDDSTKHTFVEKSRLFLKKFAKVKVQCLIYGNSKIEIFRKYFQKALQDKYIVRFFCEGGILFRENYSLYSNEISMDLCTIFYHIQKGSSKVLSIKPLSKFTSINPSCFQQVQKPEGYSHDLLGFRLYSLDNMIIKVADIQAFQGKEKQICYIFNDDLSPNSSLQRRLSQNSIKLQSFFAEAHRTKKPKRLMSYSRNSLSYDIVLLYANREKQTRKDLQIVLSSCEKKLIIGLFHHEGNFYTDFFGLLFSQLEQYEKETESSKEHFKISEVYIYYENRQGQINRIERAMRLITNKINPKSVFCLNETDFQKLYMLEYHQMKILLGSNWVYLSPLIAQLLYFQLHSCYTSIKAKQKKKFVFSFFQQTNHQLVEFVINTKSGIHFKITHSENVKKWSRRPKIERVVQIQQELQQLMEGIELCCSRTQYIVISAMSIGNEGNKRKLKYCQQFYIGFEDEKKLSKIKIERDKKLIRTDIQVQYKIRKRVINEWYQIKSFKHQIDLIEKQMQA